MGKSLSSVQAGFPHLLKEIKSRIQVAQTRAILAANAELVRLYWDIGKMIALRQQQAGWGAAVIPRLADGLRNELPEIKGFSERNIKRMLTFYREYPSPSVIVPQAASQLGQRKKVTQPAALFENSFLWSLPWFHHVMLIEKVKDVQTRLWYIQAALENGWSRAVLLNMIKSKTHRRQGQAVTNFDQRLPPPQSELATQMLKDPYVFDFLTLEKPFRERELELNLLHELERFLVELGQGFAFVGRQLHMVVGDHDFYIDLLFYHLKLRCFVVIDLKTGEFKPEHAGKMNFYLSVVDDQLRHANDQPSIGLILCQERDHIIAEYALRSVEKPIGISEYELTRALPPSLKSVLPTVEQIEAELAESGTNKTTNTKRRNQKPKIKEQLTQKPRGNKRNVQ